MSKLRLKEFFLDDNQSKLIQTQFFRINVVSYYEMLLRKAHACSDSQASRFIRFHYFCLHRELSDLENMNLGQLLKYAENNCLKQGITDMSTMSLGHHIVQFVLTDAFLIFAKANCISYESVEEKVMKGKEF